MLKTVTFYIKIEGYIEKVAIPLFVTVTASNWDESVSMETKSLLVIIYL